MSLLDVYAQNLGESVTLKHRSSVDQYNDPTFSTSTITVIWWDDERLLHAGTKEEVQQLAIIQTSSVIQKGDAITRNGVDYPVIEIQKGKNMDGDQFYTASLGPMI